MRARLPALSLALVLGCRADPPAAGPSDAPASVVVASAAPARACVSPEVRVIGADGASASLVLLHGYGASAADIEPVGRALAAGLRGVAVLVPDGCEAWEGGSSGRQWYGLEGLRDESAGAHQKRAARVREAGARVQALVAAELSRRGLPTGRVAFAGFSQGAMISEWLAVHGAPRPRAVVAFSGRFDDDGPPEQRAGAPAPVLLIHGERDRVIPFLEAARAEEALRRRGAAVERVTRPAMGHSIDEASIEAATAFLGRWLDATP